MVFAFVGVVVLQSPSNANAGEATNLQLNNYYSNTSYKSESTGDGPKSLISNVSSIKYANSAYPRYKLDITKTTEEINKNDVIQGTPGGNQLLKMTGICRFTAGISIRPKRI